jgi:diguanylate cyclase
MHLFSQPVFLVCIAAGMVAGVVSSLYLKQSWKYAVLHGVGWLVVAYLVRRLEFRDAVYWSLCAVYTVAAINFQRRLARNSTGKLAIVTGFTIWAVCLLMHPWVVQYRAYADIASHVWNMQKSLISIGMILVMLEEQVSSNEWLALHDELTGLPNRRLFAERLSTAIDRADRMRGRLALVILDLNGFKAINDSMGHQAGDQVLREVASHLRRSVREADTLARLGGDEFIIVAQDLGVDQTLDHFVKSVQSALEEPVLVEGRSMNISASLGMAVYPDDAEDSIRLLRVADQRMYALKQRPEYLPKMGANMKAGVGESGKIAVAGGK